MKNTSHMPLNGPQRFQAYLGPLFFLTGIFFLNFLVRIIPAPLLPAIEADLGVSHAQAGSLFFFISVGYFLTLLCSGFLSSKIKHKSTIVLSAVTLGLAMGCVVLSWNLWSLRGGLFLVGMTAGLYLPSAIVTLTALVHTRHWGKALAIHELAPNLGFIAAPLISEALLGLFSWRGILACLGGASVAIGLAYARFGGGGRFPGQAPNAASFKILFGEPAFWTMMALFGLGIGGTLGVYTMLPLYLITVHGMERHVANTLIGVSRISGPFMVFFAGWANDRMGPKHTLALVFLFTGSATVLLGVLSGYGITMMVFIQPILACCFSPPGFAALSAVGPKETRNVAVSLTIPMAFITGGGLIPGAIGFMGDSGIFSLGFVGLGVLIFMGFLPALLLRPPEGKVESDGSASKTDRG